MLSTYYYLFGLDAIHAYNESIENLIQKLKDDGSLGTIYRYNEASDLPTTLLSDFSGWGDFIELSECEYKYIDSKVDQTPFTLLNDFFIDYCTEVQADEDPAYVELQMDNHICVKFNEKKWYVLKENTLWNTTDAEHFEFLKQHFKLT